MNRLKHNTTEPLTETPSPAAKRSDAWRVPAIAAGLCTLAVGAILGLADLRATDISSLIRDPAAEFDVPVFAGSVSFIGIVLLFLTAGACGLAAMVSAFARPTIAGAGALSLMLALDDQFMLHERIFENAFGIPEIATLAAYAVAGTALLIAVWFGELRPWKAGLLVSLGLMGAAVLADLGPASYVVEDVVKLASFAAWSAFWIDVSRRACAPAPSELARG